MAKEKKIKNIMVMVSESMHEEFLKACEEDDITMSEYLRMCIKKKIKDMDKNN